MSFKHRRKKLLNNLLALGISREKLIESFASADIGKNARAEQVPLSRFVSLYERLSF